MSIKFGTSGWRAIISDEFTFDNVKLVTQAIADYLNVSKANKRPVLVGYDTRFLSREFAKAACKVLMANGIKVLLTDRDTPTPAISLNIIEKKLSGAINITASHNPPNYNGLKFSPSSGSAADPDITSYLEKRINMLLRKKRRIRTDNTVTSIKEFDPSRVYMSQIKKVVCLDLIKKMKLKVGVDFLYGTTRGYLDKILEDSGIKLYKLHEHINPSFNGISPNPGQRQLAELSKLVKTKKLDMGLGCDLDGDRFGIIDKDGSFVGTDEVICVILEHLIKTRKGYSSVAKSLATTAMVDRIASANGMKIVETPVGFKYIAEELLKGNCLMGAEESGGISIGGHVPEKDGILACLLALEACALNKKGIRAIFKDITKKYGRLYFERRGLLLRSKAKLFKRLDRFKPKAISGASVLDIEKTDGYKFKFSDGSWLLIRPSGTEPIVRLYAEASSKRMVQGLLRKAETLINNK